MRFSFLAAGAAAFLFSAEVFASPSGNVVLHEKRDAAPYEWRRKRSNLDVNKVIPLRIALTQQNLHRAEKFLYEVSHPYSKKYGQHWSAKQVAETFAPSKESVRVVKDWLSSSGIATTRVRQSQSLNWLHVNTTIWEAERLLKTEYYAYEHSVTGQYHVACHEYHVPLNVKPHVDIITPTVHFDIPMNIKHKRPLPEALPVSHGQQIRKRESRMLADARQAAKDGANQEVAILQPGRASEIGTSLGSLPKQGATLAENAGITGLGRCDTLITPECLRALYSFEINNASNPKNSYGIVEYSPQSYLQEDLDKFFKNFSTTGKPHIPKLAAIDGGVLVTAPANRSFDTNGESNLDLEYAMAIVDPMEVTLYQVGDAVEGASFNNFLDAIDGSYCTFDGGDDPTQDATYPDPPDGYIGPPNCGGFAATKVISTSYGYNEADLTPAYAQRQCQEYLKLALQGVTILYSSGDFGVAGNLGRCIDPSTGNYTRTNASTGVFNPSFPGGCPWVTSVGATEVANGTNIQQALVGGAASPTQPERACETVIRSGGGFSNVFEMPEYQQDTVKKWFTDSPPPYGADRFNNSQRTRGFPDISVNGANYVVTIDGNFTLIYGTSASAPTLGGMLTLINDQRLAAGKSSLGFINPVLYAHPEVMKDVTEGKNSGCGTRGFDAVPGWDPLTGLGTPIFPKMMELFLSLP